MKRPVGIVASWARPGVVRTVVGVVVLAAAVVWLSQPRSDAGGGDGVALPVVAAVGSSAVHGAEGPQNADREPSAEPPQASGSELIEVCGVGWVQADATGAWDSAAVKTVPDVLASQRAVLEAIGRDGEVGAAIATVLALHGFVRDDGAGAPGSDLLCSAPGCASSELNRHASASLLEQLAKKAASTTDPRVYAVALQECARVPGQGSCALLNVEQWARLDEGNALPWLHILDRARERNDGAQVQEALYRIGTAVRMEERVFAAAGSVADHAGPSDVDAIAAQLLALDAFLQAGARQAPFASLTSVCSAAALADANRRQACDAAAATLAERSDTLIALAVGSALGRRLGWPDDRVDAQRGLLLARDAMAREGASTTAAATAVQAANTCGGARRMLALFSRQAHAGEVQPVRDWLAANGAGVEPYARQAHEMLRRRDDAEAASTAAAAASPAAASAVALAAGGTSPYSEALPPSR